MNDVLRVADCGFTLLDALLKPFELKLNLLPKNAEIPGSYWGESEAGLIGACIYFRHDTPLHSVLHEASHYICMDPSRRKQLHRDAGGDDCEENAVCYLQILLADHLAAPFPAMNASRMMSDMDSWGYTFRLGSARNWFETDAEDARQWLIKEKLINERNQLTWQTRV